MSQTSYSNSLTALFEGQIAWNRDDADILSLIAEETSGIAFGRVLVYGDTAGKEVALPRSNQAVLTLDADLIASNVLAGNIVINGTTTAYTETYATSHNATMTALAAEIQALDGILTATASGRTITVLADPSTDVYFSSGAVTGGVSQAVVTLTNTCTGSFVGVSLHEERQPDSNGVVEYNDGEAVSVGRVGYFVVTSDDALNPGDSVYVRFFDQTSTATDKQTGMLASAAGSSPTKAKLWSNASVIVGCSGGGLAVIRVNL